MSQYMRPHSVIKGEAVFNDDLKPEVSGVTGSMLLNQNTCV